MIAPPPAVNKAVRKGGGAKAYNNYKAMQVIANPGGTNRASKKETITNKLAGGLPSFLVDDVGNDLTRLH